MKVERKKISELKRPERNVRMHTDKQITEFQRSVKMFGQIRPIVVDENNIILAGNGLFETMLLMGYEEADCYVVKGLSEKEKKKLMLADNRIFNLGVDDMKAFDDFIAELEDDLDVPGFDEALLKSLQADVDEIDDMMSSYGLIDEDKKAEISAAKDAYAHSENTEQAIRQEPSHAVEQSSETSNHSVGECGFVVCPKCGEKIWL